MSVRYATVQPASSGRTDRVEIKLYDSPLRRKRDEIGTLGPVANRKAAQRLLSDIGIESSVTHWIGV